MWRKRARAYWGKQYRAASVTNTLSGATTEEEKGKGGKKGKCGGIEGTEANTILQGSSTEKAISIRVKYK